MRFVLVGLIALAMVPGVSPGQHLFDCAEAYNRYLQDLVRRGLSPEDRAVLQLWAFRAYNAYETGDLEDPKAVFNKLEREKRALKPIGATKSSEESAIHSAMEQPATRPHAACSKRAITSCRPVFVSAHSVHTRISSAPQQALEKTVRFRTIEINCRLRSKLAHCGIIEREHPGIRRPPSTPSHLDLCVALDRDRAGDCKFGGDVAA